MAGVFYHDASLDNEQSFRVVALPADSTTGYYHSISKVGSVDSKTISRQFGNPMLPGTSYSVMPAFDIRKAGPGG